MGSGELLISESVLNRLLQLEGWGDNNFREILMNRH